MDFKLPKLWHFDNFIFSNFFVSHPILEINFVILINFGFTAQGDCEIIVFTFYALANELLLSRDN